MILLKFLKNSFKIENSKSYHAIENTEATEILGNTNTNAGTYLIRKSKAQGKYTLSFKTNNPGKNISSKRIEITDEGKYQIEGEKCNMKIFDDLIKAVGNKIITDKNVELKPLTKEMRTNLQQPVTPSTYDMMPPGVSLTKMKNAKKKYNSQIGLMK